MAGIYGERDALASDGTGKTYAQNFKILETYVRGSSQASARGNS
ncbi:hypothetical protein [Streptomyces sp. ISL-99]|nr:hypothetical protein [Streptomyces sp. ISL-99]